MYLFIRSLLRLQMFSRAIVCFIIFLGNQSFFRIVSYFLSLILVIQLRLQTICHVGLHLSECRIQYLYHLIYLWYWICQLAHLKLLFIVFYIRQIIKIFGFYFLFEVLHVFWYYLSMLYHYTVHLCTSSWCLHIPSCIKCVMILMRRL